MTEKKFTLEETDWSYRIRDNGAIMKIPKIVDLLNEQHEEKEQLKQENKELKKLLELISRAHSFTKEESVKEILRNEIKAIDTVTGDSAMAWNDYCVLSKFFKKQYGEHWDNE